MAERGAPPSTRDPWLPGWQAHPIWRDGLAEPAGDGGNVPADTDVLIVGSGYTGLNAALETVRAGRRTLVLDAETPGWGCSTRNGGQISTSIKPSAAELTARYGAERARAIRAEGRRALEWIEARIGSEGIACAFQRGGRFHAAHTPRHYEALARTAETLTRDEGVEAHPVPRGDQHAELGTDFYSGGVVYPRDASLDPARYHLGLLAAARGAGATVIGHCGVRAISRTNNGFAVMTEKGAVTARDVIVATNGYSLGLVPWITRRVIPIGSYVIATEPLPPDLMDRLFPKDRVVSDTRKVIYYFRASPDRTRVVFGGRVSADETDPAVSGPRLYHDMCQIFPELTDYRISHSWMGQVAYSFDSLAHIGIHDGIHFALCYCGSGVSMSSYLGMRLGQKVVGNPEGRTAFDDLHFPTRPFYAGKPWFLPPLVAWYRWRDRVQWERSRPAA